MAQGASVASELGRLAADTSGAGKVRIFTITYGPEALTGDDVLRLFAKWTFGQALHARTLEITVVLRSIVSQTQMGRGGAGSLPDSAGEGAGAAVVPS